VTRIRGPGSIFFAVVALEKAETSGAGGKSDAPVLPMSGNTQPINPVKRSFP
jgi:hypothetical protein